MTIGRRDSRPSRRQMLALIGGGAAASLLTRSRAEAQGVDPRIDQIVTRTISVDMHNHVRAAVVRDPSAPRPPDPVADVAGEMKRSGFTAVCATYALDGSGGAGEGWPQNAKPGEYYILHQQYLDAYDRLITAQKIRRVLNMKDLQAVHDQGVPAIIQDSEGLQWIEGHLERVGEAHRRGARLLQLVHFSPDLVKPLGDAQGRPPVGGLTPFGADVIKECNRLGIVVDLAHGAFEMVKGAQKVATQPFVVTHTAMDSAIGRGTTSDGLRSRLLSRDHAKIVADAGGVIGIWNLFPTTKDYVSAVKEMVDVVGVDHVGLGSDTSIASTTNSKWPDQNGGFLYAVTREMLGQGFAPAEIGKIAGGNFCRVFAKVTEGRA